MYEVLTCCGHSSDRHNLVMSQPTPCACCTSAQQLLVLAVHLMLQWITAQRMRRSGMCMAWIHGMGPMDTTLGSMATSAPPLLGFFVLAWSYILVGLTSRHRNSRNQRRLQQGFDCGDRNDGQAPRLPFLCSMTTVAVFWLNFASKLPAQTTQLTVLQQIGGPSG